MFHLLHLLVGCMAIVMAKSSAIYNDRPVVGVLSMLHYGGTETYVAASYVKWLEAAGARSIVIPFDADDETVERIMTQINGVLLPGGSQVHHVPNSVKKILTMAKKINDDGDKFPVWGTCLGFEYLMTFFAGHSNPERVLQGGFDAHDLSGITTFTDEVQDSRIFADEELKKILSSQPVAFHYHIHGLEPERFLNDAKLSSFFHLIATGSDRTGREFVNIIEAKSYPFYGVQFHPEKTNFEHATIEGTNDPYEDINHSNDAVLAMFQMARFFVNEARQNRGGYYTDVREYPSVWTYKSVSGEYFEQKLVISRKKTIFTSVKETMHMLGGSIILALLVFVVWVGGRFDDSKSREEVGLLMA